MKKRSEATGVLPAQSLAEGAYDQIQDMIIKGQLKPYELVSESELTRQFDYGRTPIREALQRLSFEGFVEILPRRGILVAPVDINSQLELLETRRPLELQMVTLAAKRARTSERERMLELADQLELAVSRDDRALYLEINRTIHKTESAATGNRFLQKQIDIIHNLSRRFWYSFISDTQSFSQAAKFHTKTLRAIADGDAKAAQNSSTALLDLLEKVTRASIDDRPE